MKQIFKLSIILLVLTCCVSSFDASAKTKRKAKSAATTSKWVKIFQSDDNTCYVNTDYKIQKDNDGYYILTVKTVPNKSTLEARKKELFARSNDTKFKNYTHNIEQWKVDIDGMRVMPLPLSLYANNILLLTLPRTQKWENCIYDSFGYEMVKVVRYTVKGY